MGDGPATIYDAPCPDADGDGFPDRTCGGTDCDDADRAVHPGAPERCNGRDDDCDGAPETAPQGDAFCAATAPGVGGPTLTSHCQAPNPGAAPPNFTTTTCVGVYVASGRQQYRCWAAAGSATDCCDVTVVCPR